MLGSEHPHGRRREVSLEGIVRFVGASEGIRFEAEDRQQLYGWVEQMLIGQQYAEQGKAARACCGATSRR